MTDQVKERDNKDAEESGRPVQLDPEEQIGEPGQQQGDDELDQPQPGREPVPQPGQQPAPSR